MKRTKFLFNQICDIKNLHQAYYKASKRKHNSKNYLYFNAFAYNRLEEIRQQLLEQNFIFGQYRQFKIFDPKERTITAASFEERIIHHAIINVMEELFERQFIFHTYACRKEKGTHKAIIFAQKKCRTSKYFLKLDIRKYFDNIDHDILIKKLYRIIGDSDCILLLQKIIDSYCVTKNKGIPIGNLTSQYFANFYLSSLDHFIMEKLKPKGYVRYMDDMLIFSDNLGSLRGMYGIIKRYCDLLLNLELKKPIYGNCKTGIPFLGCLVYEDKIKLLQEKKILKYKKIRKIDRLVKKGEITEEKAIERITAILEGFEYWKRQQK